MGKKSFPKNFKKLFFLLILKINNEWLFGKKKYIMKRAVTNTNKYALQNIDTHGKQI